MMLYLIYAFRQQLLQICAVHVAVYADEGCFIPVFGHHNKTVYNCIIPYGVHPYRLT